MAVSADQMLKMVTNPAFAATLAAMQNANGARRNDPTNIFDYGSTLKEAWTTTNLGLANPTIYGRHSIFDPCFDGDVMGLQVQTHGILSWLGWRKNPFWKRTVQFITWWRGDGAEEGATGAGSPCEDPTGWEWGECSYELCHESWYHRQGDPLGPHNTQTRCETSQRARLNGVLITDDWEWQLNGIMQVLKQDINWDVIHGSHMNDWEMNGLESVIRVGYSDNSGNNCPMVDSWLVDWEHDDLDGDVNGWGNFFNFLHEITSQIEYRSYGIGDIMDTDMVLFTSRFMADCILDAFACYSVCGVTAVGDIAEQSLRAQTLAYRQSLNGGPMYDGTRAVGYISLKSGRRIPLMVDDAFDITRPSANYCSDVYLLTRRIGNRDVFYGEYLDLSSYGNLMRKFNEATGIRVESAGRFAFKGKEDNWCGMAMAGTSPELYLSAPWAQARIMNVCCSRVLKPVVGTPFQPDYTPGGSGLYGATEWGMVCTDVPDAGTQSVLQGR